MLGRAAAGGDEGEWLRAVRQSAGRGRMGRDWVEQPGNLYASTIVRLRDGDPQTTLLAMVAGIAFAKTVIDYAGSGRVQLKWPNDVMTGNAKMGGILLERQGDAVVAGFGLNIVSAPQVEGRETIALATILSEGIRAPDAGEVCEKLANHFAATVMQWRAGKDAGERSPVLDIWSNLAHPIGTPVAINDISGTAVRGEFAGLDDDGALRLRSEDGTITIIRAGDVSLIADRKE